MKILHVTPYYLPAYRYGGPIYSVHGLCKSIVALGHEVHVFTTNLDVENTSNVILGKPVDIDGVQVWYFPSYFLKKIFYAPLLAKKIKEKMDYFDLIHSHTVYNWPSWIASSYARKFKKSYVISPRGMLVKKLIQKKSRWIKNFWINFLEKKNLEGASAIHLTSLSEQAELSLFNFNTKRQFVISNGIDTPEVNAVDGQRSSEIIARAIAKGPFILFLGRVHWAKGLDGLIQALSLVPNQRLIIAGNDEDGYQLKMRILAVSLGVSDRVEFVGGVYGPDKRRLFRAARFFISPSHSESFGNSVLEAMAEGCPVIVTPGVGLSEFVQRYGGGIVAEGSVSSLAEAMNYMAQNPEACKRMGGLSSSAVMENFEWSKIAKKMVGCYEQLL